MRSLILSLACASISLWASLAHAESFSDKCPDIVSCAKVVSDMLGQKYVYDSDVKGKIGATANLELTKENVEWLFTDMLYTNGFSRLPLGNGVFQILRQRDVKDLAVPFYEASKQIAPSIPHTWDFATMRYKAANPEVVETISRMTRNFMPPNSRIISSDTDGSLLITDSGPNLKKMYEIIRGLDEKPTPQLKKKWEQEEKERRAERMSHRQENQAVQAASKASQ